MRCRRWKKNDPAEPADHALGRSRGGYSTKIHLLCDRNGHPLSFALTAGQSHETTVLLDVLQKADTELHDLDGNPVAWPLSLAGDMAYRGEWIDELLMGLGIRPVVPSKSNEIRGSRLVEFNRPEYRDRNIIERLIGWLKECRRIFSRYEKTAINYAGMIKMAFIQRYLKLTCP